MTDSSPFSGLVSIWLAKIEMAWEQKNKRFGVDARDGMFFYKGPYDKMYDGTYGAPWGAGSGRVPTGPVASIQPPAVRVTLNKVSDMVQLFGPYLYYKNPNRKVTARKSVVTTSDILGASAQAYPQYAQLMQQIAQMAVVQNNQDIDVSDVMQALLDATPCPLDLKTESRKAVDEALITGLGLLWTQKWTPPGSPTSVVGSLFGTQADLLIDPDATSWNNALWIVKRTICSVWEAEKRFKLPPGMLKANVESNNRQGEIRGMGFDGTLLRTGGRTCDMVIYYEVWSKTGLGARLKGAADNFTQQVSEAVAGDYAYIVVSPGQNFPLNAPPQMMAQEGTPQAMQALQQAFMWETPFYVDGGWPCVPLSFHEIPNDVWPASHVSFAMGQLKAMNWIASWVLQKIRTTCRDFLAVPKRLSDEFKQLILSGPDLTMLEIPQEYKSVRECVEFLQQQGMNADIWEVMEYMSNSFDEATGLTELMYGMSSRQYRSAAEAEIKKDQANVRPDDMANRVEDWQSLAARREAFASTWHLKADDVKPFLGMSGAACWKLFVEDRDPASWLYDYNYRVEAGSIRKPNRSRDAENAQALMQQVLPVFIQYATMTGNTQPMNSILTLWALSMDIDPTVVQLPPMLPPMPEPAQGGGGNQPKKQAA